MQFHVPQFIDVEDKIFGPLTFKQFVYVAGGVGLCVTIYVFVPYQILSFPLMAIIGGFSLALAFYRVNDKPFIDTVQAAVRYIMKSRLYVWKRRKHEDKSKAQIKKEAKQIQKVVSRMSKNNTDSNKLNNMSWSIDVSDHPDKKSSPEPTSTSPNRSPS